MGGSVDWSDNNGTPESAPRVHGWFQVLGAQFFTFLVCPACAWVVPSTWCSIFYLSGLPRVCMGGSMMLEHQAKETASAPRVHGWFQVVQYAGVHESVCPACAWVVPYSSP